MRRGSEIRAAMVLADRRGINAETSAAFVLVEIGNALADIVDRLDQIQGFES